MRLNPFYYSWYPYFLGVAQYCLEQYEEAAISQERAFKIDPNSSTWWLAATYAQLGREQEAVDVLGDYIKRRGWVGMVPVESTFGYQPFKNPKDLERFADGLLKAGLPIPWNPVFRRHYEEAISEAERVIALNPNDAEAQFAMGETLIFVGRSAEAIEYINSAMKLNPDYSSYYLWTLGLAQFCLEQYEEAATTFEKVYYELSKKDRYARYAPTWILAATYGQLGREQEAAKVLATYMKKKGFKGYTVERVVKYLNYAFKDPKDTDRFAEGLHKAGLPMK